DLSAAAIQGNARECLELVGKIASQGLDMPRLSRDLVEHFRNLLVAALISDPETEKQGAARILAAQLLDLPENEIEDLKHQAKSLTVETLMDYFSLMAAADEALTRSAYPRFALETALVRLATLPKCLPVAELLERLERLEDKLGEEDTALSQPPAEDLNKSLGTATVAGVGTSSVPEATDNKSEIWKNFVAFVMKDKKFLGSYLEKVQLLEVSSNHLKIGVEDRRYLGYLQDVENLNMLKDFARRFFSSDIAVTIGLGISAAAGAESGGVAAKRADPLSDITEEVVRVLGGSIKEVKRNI
ncbi:MAG: hypothetical protein ACREQW_26090, partial [Candidatus Binatia bacterium]